MNSLYETLRRYLNETQIIFNYCGPQVNNTTYMYSRMDVAITYVSSRLVCLYLFLSVVRYFPAASQSDHLSIHTDRKPGCWMMHSGGFSTSFNTNSELTASMHLDISRQHWHSRAFWSISMLQLPQVHLEHNVKRHKYVASMWNNERKYNSDIETQISYLPATNSSSSIEAILQFRHTLGFFLSLFPVLFQPFLIG